MEKQANSNMAYVVMASVEYEGSNCVRVFLVRDEAELFARQCREYSAVGRPECPALEAPDA